LRQANEFIKYLTIPEHMTGKNMTFTREGLMRYARAHSLYIEHYHYRL